MGMASAPAPLIIWQARAELGLLHAVCQERYRLGPHLARYGREAGEAGDSQEQGWGAEQEAQPRVESLLPLEEGDGAEAEQEEPSFFSVARRCRDSLVEYAQYARGEDVARVWDKCGSVCDGLGRRPWSRFQQDAGPLAVAPDLPMAGLPHDPTPPADSAERTGVPAAVLARLEGAFPRVASEALALLAEEFGGLAAAEGSEARAARCFGAHQLHCAVTLFQRQEGFDARLCARAPTICELFGPALGGRRAYQRRMGEEAAAAVRTTREPPHTASDGERVPSLIVTTS
jgi:hypothetical protein